MANLETFSKYTLDRALHIPLYFQFKNMLLKMIEHNELVPGEIIPTEYELCDVFDISRTTVRQSLSELVEEGVFYRVKGRGTFVSHRKVIHDLANERALFTKELQNKGFLPGTRMLEFRTMPAPFDVAKNLKLPANTDVISLKRVRYANNEPLLVNHTYLPYSLCKNVTGYDMTVNSLFELLSDNIHTKIKRTIHQLESIIPTAQDCENLNITKSIGVQLLKSVGYNHFDMPIHYTISKYRGDKNTFLIEQFHD